MVMADIQNGDYNSIYDEFLEDDIHEKHIYLKILWQLSHTDSDKIFYMSKQGIRTWKIIYVFKLK